VVNYTLSGEADADLQNIAETSLRQWGIARAEKYILGLHEAFQRLAKFLTLGRDAGHIRPGYRKVETASHSVLYRTTENGVPVVRALHQRMDFDWNL